ncbi:hypothetical protein CYLTODRAFT_445616 [Cylindrobasidium torrendii FP15055 ss-10]|uniref:C2H2-type domain-containing protein n=1 Tax=Cylindrobasidium torrendii FP15055 ss-10 TaxID=1314674 RepID=A0A0D7B464_9AGAR|nr:hypothetical protein CYLTODRAFT_445616 [Cylindrobasidium torrendii FP15055 ss-10]
MSFTVRQAQPQSKCTTCGATFKSVALVKRHQKMAHATYCNLCQKSFLDNTRLMEHFRGSKWHPTCQHCGVGIEDDTMLSEHVHEVHVVQKYVENNPLPPAKERAAKGRAAKTAAKRARSDGGRSSLSSVSSITMSQSTAATINEEPARDVRLPVS